MNYGASQTLMTPDEGQQAMAVIVPASSRNIIKTVRTTREFQGEARGILPDDFIRQGAFGEAALFLVRLVKNSLRDA